MRKKLLFYTMIMTKGGTENTIANLVNHFINEFDIILVTNIKCDIEYELNPQIQCVSIDAENKKNEKNMKKVITKLSLQRSQKLKEIILKEKPDLLLTFLPEPTIRALGLKKYFKNIPIIVAIRNHPKQEFTLPFLKIIRNYYYRKADKIILQDNTYAKYLKKNIQHKITVIPNFLSPNLDVATKTTIREKKIVTVTRLEKQKNISLLIKAFSKLNRKFDGYKLYICGTGSEKNYLEEQIKRLNLEKRAFLLGRVKRIEDVIKNASIFVLPSNYEGMPNVLLEAMALSLPVITTRSTEVIDKIIKSGVNGIVVKKKDVYELTSAMEYLLENPHIASMLGERASKVRVDYSQDSIIEKWYHTLKIYL